MIDTIRIKLELCSLPDNYIEFISEKVNRKRFFTNEHNVTTMIGDYENFYITFGLTGLYITGSLTRFVKGSTMQTAYKDELIYGIYKLSNDLKLDLFNGKVLRIDIAGNIILKHPVTDYFECLSNLKRVERFRQKKSLSFMSTYKDVLFYDKTYEQKKKKKEADKLLINKNIMRYEYRFKKPGTLERLLKCNCVSLKILFENYNTLIKNWVDGYLSIDKNNEPQVFNEEVFSVKGNFEKQLQIQGIHKLGGLHRVLEMIDSSKRKGQFKKYPNQSSNLKSKLRSLMNNSNLVIVQQINVELTSKVKMIGFYATN